MNSNDNESWCESNTLWVQPFSEVLYMSCLMNSHFIDKAKVS